MSSWWYRLADRPLDAQRLRVFSVAAGLLVLVACGLALTVGDPTAPPAGEARNGPVVAATFGDAPASRLSVDGRGAVIRQARRFLRGYLPYLYGQGPARAIRGSTVALRRRLAAIRVRVPPAAKQRDPRVVSVAAKPLDDGRWHAAATVADGGVSRYPIELLVTIGAGGVRVAEVSSE